MMQGAETLLISSAIFSARASTITVNDFELPLRLIRVGLTDCGQWMAGWKQRKRAGIHDPQPFDPNHSGFRVNYGHGIIYHSHFVCIRCVPYSHCDVFDCFQDVLVCLCLVGPRPIRGIDNGWSHGATGKRLGYTFVSSDRNFLIDGAQVRWLISPGQLNDFRNGVW